MDTKCRSWRETLIRTYYGRVGYIPTLPIINKKIILKIITKKQNVGFERGVIKNNDSLCGGKNKSIII